MTPADRDERSLNRGILALAVPAFATLVAEPILILVDTTIVGRLGTAQLAGLTLASNVIGVLVGLSIFLAYGTTATVGRRLGAGDRRGALAGGMDGMVLGLVIGLLLAAGLALAGPWLLGLYGSTPEATGYAGTYLRIVALGLPAQLVSLASTGVLRGLQDTRTPLWVAIGVNLANIALSLTLVYGVGLGIAGAAIGTAVAQWGGATVLGLTVLRGAARNDVRFRPRLGGVLRAARAGGWLVLRAATLQAAITVTTFTAAGMGEASLAGHQVAYALWQTMTYALDAFAIAAQALIALRLGAGDVAGARRITRRVLVWGVGFGLLVGLVLVALRPVLIGFFSADPGVHDVLMVTLVVLACVVPIGGVTFVLDGVLIGAGDARYLSLVGLLVTLVYTPLALAVRATGAGLAWLWAGYGVWIAARALTLWLRARGTAWMQVGT
ncbi:putative efflux protein, MATE family [Raineyella antarctica]|uniref:Putative efflux protein, MATE family n=1 Tax=Raineyella antarctica TaxID=1577474 RepID=A0A1G6HE47_9ACTN|nr:MATE family efflux transporter [Raineyella antarctica]SDB92434.1 putative efflux protein, MATE family [Raineyella antarctica]